MEKLHVEICTLPMSMSVKHIPYRKCSFKMGKTSKLVITYALLLSSYAAIKTFG